jgi:hypothetical protein
MLSAQHISLRKVSCFDLSEQFCLSLNLYLFSLEASTSRTVDSLIRVREEFI